MICGAGVQGSAFMGALGVALVQWQPLIYGLRIIFPNNCTLYAKSTKKYKNTLEKIKDIGYNYSNNRI